MKKILSSLLIAFCLAFLWSCQDDISPFSPNLTNGSLKDGVEISLRFPDMGAPNTRALGEADENTLANLDLFIFVFDGSNLVQTMHVTPKETEIADDLENDSHGKKNGHIRFKTTLPQTDKDAIVHIVAVKEDADKSFSKQIERIGFGPEDIVMPALSVSNDQDAYWQRIELGCPIKQTTKDADGNPNMGTEEELEKIFENPIPLIRNFAKINLTSTAENFTVLGWTIVNDLNGGSVVPNFSRPGNPDIEFPDFINWNGNKYTSSYTPKNYSDLKTDGYQGVSLSGASLRHTIDQIGGSNPDAGKSWNNETIYLYERKYSTVNPLYLLIYGEYQGRGGSGSSKKKYYKLLLGEKDDYTGIVSDYNIIRNIEYTVNITSVHPDAGYSTPAEAAGAPASNNISGDVVTKDMFSISDGIDMLYVNAINFIVTQPGQKIDFRYRYIEDITGTPNQNDNQVNYDYYYDDGNGERVGLPKPGDGVVVESWEKTNEQITDENNSSIKWSQIIITPKDPTDELRQESFYIFSCPSVAEGGTLGLNRKINLILRNPWDYLRVGVFPGHWNDTDQFPDFDHDKDEDGKVYVGPEKGAPLTLFLELPAGLPEALFPLDFTIESNRQNIENAAAGNAVVDMGTSLFEGVTDNRIKFIKTITWSDYAPNGETSTAASRVIRIRLNTTTSISSLGSDDAILTTLRIYNPYFNLKETEFMRDKNQSVTPPSNSVRTVIDKTTRVETTTEMHVIWNFSDTSWDDAAKDAPETDNYSIIVFGKGENGNDEARIHINTKTTITTTTKVTKTVNGVVTDTSEKTETVNNETDIYNNADYPLKLAAGSNNSGRRWNTKFDTEEHTDRYFFTAHSDNNISLSVLTIAPQEDLESAELRITAAPNSGTSVTPNITVPNLPSISVSNTNQAFNDIQTKVYPINYTTRNNDNRTITIKPAGNNANQQIKFYSIELIEKYHTDVTTPEHTEVTEEFKNGE